MENKNTVADNDMSINVPEELTERVRMKLREDKIKLWLEPYTLANGEQGEIPLVLCAEYSESLSCSVDMMMMCIEGLRQHAVNKLKCKQQYADTHLATLYIRIPATANTVQLSQGASNTRHGSLKLSDIYLRSCTGLMLKERICQELSNKSQALHMSMIKLIAAGRVITDKQTLEQQNITNLSHILCILISSTSDSSNETKATSNMQSSDSANSIAHTTHAARLLADSAMYDDDAAGPSSNHIIPTITDQSGQTIELPPDERRALTLAMTLNEKGRAALKRNEYGIALTLLLEADKEFGKCRSSILTAADNFSILCLDIVWCYVLLRMINMLPDADARLQTAHKGFNTAYGTNMERLQRLAKGGSGAELALYVRLHLLEGIVAYHKQQYFNARELIGRSEHYLKMLQVSDDDLTTIMSMGFTASESRIALRKAQGDVQKAVTVIMELREERRKQKLIQQEERRQRQLERSLGFTHSGDRVNVTTYHQLLSRGVEAAVAKLALQHANNDLDIAVRIIQETPEVLVQTPRQTQSQRGGHAHRNTSGGPQEQLQQQIEQLLRAQGIDPAVMRGVVEQLEGFNSADESGTVRALQQTLTSVGIPANVLSEEQIQQMIDTAKAAAVAASGSSSNRNRAAAGSDEAALVDELVSDMTSDYDDHLDLTLDEEHNMILEYRALLDSTST